MRAASGVLRSSGIAGGDGGASRGGGGVESG